jgi:hypothetical protein
MTSKKKRFSYFNVMPKFVMTSKQQNEYFKNHYESMSYATLYVNVC